VILNWQNTNRYVAYPIKEDSSLTDITGNLTIPNDFLMDFFATYYNAAESLVELKTIDVDAGGTFMVVTFMIGGVTPAAFVVPANAALPFEGDFVIQVGNSITTRVNPVFGPGVLAILTEPSYYGNIYTFTAQLEPSVIAAPYKHSVTKVVAKNIDIDNNEVVLPDVGGNAITFINGYNSVITSNNVDTVSFTASLGAGAGQPCEPIYDAIDCSCGIYFINGKHPDWLGNFKFEAGKYITVTNDPANYTITIKTSVREDSPKCQDPQEDL